jgi:hypothetical protein
MSIFYQAGNRKMAGKKGQVVQLQSEVNTEEEWNKLLEKDGLVGKYCNKYINSGKTGKTVAVLKVRESWLCFTMFHTNSIQPLLIGTSV